MVLYIGWWINSKRFTAYCREIPDTGQTWESFNPVNHGSCWLFPASFRFPAFFFPDQHLDLRYPDIPGHPPFVYEKIALRFCSPFSYGPVLFQRGRDYG
jgi:hypothetical protein